MRPIVISLMLLISACTEPTTVPAQGVPAQYQPQPTRQWQAPRHEVQPSEQRDDAEVKERLREIGQEILDAQHKLGRGPEGQ